MTTPTPTSPTRPIRCAIYTRKSTEEGLEQEFNSLDAQREGAIAFIASQKHEGWTLLPGRYDDGGFTGGTIDRPALKRLMADIEAGGVDCVVVYKVDRLSRSLMDFAKLMELFERKGVSFVSVTQQFNTTHSMGRLTLNILLSFAQFEREIISERTRDKIAAARRRGKYAQGKPLLGYDYQPAPPPFTGKRLVPSPAEASMVREIFELYLRERSLLRVAAIINARGWRSKAWTSTSGRAIGGSLFGKTSLSRLLRCPIYAGKIPHHGQLYQGEHEAIVDPELFSRVQAQLKLAGAQGGLRPQGGQAGLLRGLVRCGHGHGAMSHVATSKPASKAEGGRGRVSYRYYLCNHASKHGRDACPSPSVPAAELESFVLDQIRARLDHEGLREQVIGQAVEVMRAAAARRVEMAAELRRAMGAKSAGESERRDLAARLAALQRQIARDEERQVDEDELAGALESFDGLWEAMTAAERRELVELLIAGVEHDGVAGSVTLTFTETAAALHEQAVTE